jgi:hypothetical protein
MASAVVRAYKGSGVELQPRIENSVVVTVILVLRSTLLSAVLCPVEAPLAPGRQKLKARDSRQGDAPSEKFGRSSERKRFFCDFEQKVAILSTTNEL